MEVKPTYIEPGSPRADDYYKSFNVKLRDELSGRELLDTLKETHMLTELWQMDYKTRRHHSSLGQRLPAPQTIL